MNPKPNWDNAPAWAQYIAMNNSGTWYWHEQLPTYSNGLWNSDGKLKEASGDLARSSLKKRPALVDITHAYCRSNT